MTNHNKAISWFEIPAVDLHRAQAFYQQVLAVQLTPHSMQGSDMAIFPYDREGGATGGCVLRGDAFKPSRDGAVVYINAGAGESAIDAALGRVAAAGGAVALTKTALPPGMGWFAHIVDTEGNRVGLHATPATAS